jgi:hypothetical protein
VAGEAHVNAAGSSTAVYGIAPHRESSSYIYFDSFGESASQVQLGLNAANFSSEDAIAKLNSLQEQLAAANAQHGNGANMNLYVDSAKYQQSNGLLLHIDSGYRSANQRWSAEDLSEKLVSDAAQTAYDAHYTDPTVLFSKYDVIELPEQSVATVGGMEGAQSPMLSLRGEELQIELAQDARQGEALSTEVARQDDALTVETAQGARQEAAAYAVDEPEDEEQDEAANA